MVGGQALKQVNQDRLPTKDMLYAAAVESLFHNVPSEALPTMGRVCFVPKMLLIRRLATRPGDHQGACQSPFGL